MNESNGYIPLNRFIVYGEMYVLRKLHHFIFYISIGKFLSCKNFDKVLHYLYNKRECGKLNV